MSHLVLPKWKELAAGLAAGVGTRPTGTLKMALLRLDGTLTDTYVQTITGATAASPIVLTTALGAVTTAHDIIVALGVGGTLGANGTFFALSPDATHITEYLFSQTNGTGVGAYTSGGVAINLSQLQYYSQIDGCVIGTPVSLASATFTGGVLSSTSPVSHASVPAGWVHGFVIYLDTGTPATSPVLMFSDGKQRVTCTTTAAGGATVIYTSGIEGPIPASTVLTWSNGIQSTVSGGSAAANLVSSSIPVNALGSSITAGQTCDAPWFNSTFPVFLSSTGTINVSLPSPGAYWGSPEGWFEI